MKKVRLVGSNTGVFYQSSKGVNNESCDLWRWAIGPREANTHRKRRRTWGCCTGSHRYWGHCKVKETAPDVILLEHSYAEMDGIRCAKELNEQQSTNHYFCDRRTTIIRLLHSKHTIGYLLKPANKEELLQVLSSIIVAIMQHSSEISRLETRAGQIVNMCGAYPSQSWSWLRYKISITLQPDKNTCKSVIKAARF